MPRKSVLLISILFSIAMTSELLPGVAHAGETQVPPRVDHILLTVSDMKASVAFYRDMIGLRVRSLGFRFTTLEAGNLGIYLSTSRRPWETQEKSGHPGSGMYPHFEIEDVPALVQRLKDAGYKIIQEAETHDFGTEAFVADPDGYTWALFSWRKKK